MRLLVRAAPGRVMGPVPVTRSGPPWICLGLAGAALSVSFMPGIADLLQYDRFAVGRGEVWRLLTGQFVHWTPRMALVDLGVLLLLGAVIEIRSRRLLACACFAGFVLTGSGIHWLAPAITHYRGASGVATTLFVLVAVMAVPRGRSIRSRGAAMALALGLLAAKMAWESASPAGFFAGPLPEGVEVLPLAHLLGAIAAVPMLMWTVSRRTPSQPASPAAPDPRACP